ncbi:MAG TPA: choice-of-anchor E domain-containing protein, partial [Opitutaceae bacterium]|nr:choice-of-anchor E domain-containing protein [Opitutaceae bacterium]
FDSTLGTLTSVNLTLTSTADGTVSVINFTASPQSFTNAFASMTVNVTGPDGTATTVTPVSTQATGIANPPAFTITNFNPVGATAVSSVSAGNLGMYEAIGGGTLDFIINSSATGSYGGTGTPGAVGFGGSAAAYGDLQITYDYTVVPEPATYTVLVGAAALGLVLLRRRMLAA